MKSTVTITVDTEVLRIFKTQHSNVSGRISELMKASINYKEPKEETNKEKIIRAKADLAEAIAQEKKDQAEKEKMTWENGN